MPKHKLIKLLFIFIVLTSLWPTACTKRYEEDPFTMHFVRMRKRITGEWHIKKILIDGEDFTHLIYMDTVPFYSVYQLQDYRRSLGNGQFTMSTYNNIQYRQGKVGFDLFFFLNKDIRDKSNTIRFWQDPDLHQLYPIYNYGPINMFWKIGNNSKPGIYWVVKKLTKKEMHLQTTYNTQKYELYFEKH